MSSDLSANWVLPVRDLEDARPVAEVVASRIQELYGHRNSWLSIDEVWLGVHTTGVYNGRPVAHFNLYGNAHDTLVEEVTALLEPLLPFASGPLHLHGRWDGDDFDYFEGDPAAVKAAEEQKALAEIREILERFDAAGVVRILQGLGFGGPAPSRPTDHGCCGCSCRVCEHGHANGGTHTDACRERFAREMWGDQ